MPVGGSGGDGLPGADDPKIGRGDTNTCPAGASPQHGPEAVSEGPLGGPRKTGFGRGKLFPGGRAECILRLGTGLLHCALADVPKSVVFK